MDPIVSYLWSKRNYVNYSQSYTNEAQPQTTFEYLYLKHVANITNMQLLNEMSNINNNINNNSNNNECHFLAANLHAKSIFGEQQ